MSAIRDECVSGQNGGSTGIGQNRKPWPLGTWLLAENFGHVKQVRDGADAQHTRATEGGIKNFVVKRAPRQALLAALAPGSYRRRPVRLTVLSRSLSVPSTARLVAAARLMAECLQEHG